MIRLVTLGMACAAFALATPDTAFAHGGQYRGPGDVVPPNPGGGGGRSPGPSGPSTPGPGGPATPGPGGPSTPGPAGPGSGGPAGPGPAGGPTSGGGIVLQDDLTQWQFWWEFNKDPYINLREAVFDPGTVTDSEEFYMGGGRESVSKDTLRPSDSQILGTILPKLAQALDATTQRDITSSCMIAMAKIGKSTEQIDILKIFESHLTEKDQEIRESAAVAMGISQMPEAVPVLKDLLADTGRGSELVGGGSVDDRTRAFSAFGLGLIGFATSDHSVKGEIWKALDESLRDDAARNRNIRVPVINAIGLLRPDPADENGKDLFLKCVKTLDDYWQEDLGAGDQLIQSHVPPAMAKLFQDVDVEADEDLKKLYDGFREAYLDQLNGRSRSKKSNIDVDRSLVLALGRMTQPNNGRKPKDGPPTPELDLKISLSLQQYYESGKDQQAKFFSLLSVGMIGGIENRNFLIEALEKGSKAMEKPWAALGLGVLAYNNFERDPNAPVDRLISDRMKSWLDKVKTPGTLSALAVGLGLSKSKDAADQLRSMLEKYKNQDDLAGYICIGLALMDDERSQQQIRTLVETSVRRPNRLLQAAIALGKLGDKSAASTLQTMMTEGDQNLAKMSAIASALGFIGDRRSIDPLVRMLFDEGLTDLTRAFAAVALGGIADKELLPWNSKIAVNMNYRAAVETLTNQISGVLDIL